MLRDKFYNRKKMIILDSKVDMKRIIDDITSICR